VPVAVLPTAKLLSAFSLKPKSDRLLVRIAESDLSAFIAKHRDRSAMSSAVQECHGMSIDYGNSGILTSSKHPICSMLVFPKVTLCPLRSGGVRNCPQRHMS
jgi:hypothetical protein